MQVGVHLIAFVDFAEGEASLERFLELVRLADDYGFDRITTGEHSSGGRLECVVAQTCMARETRYAAIGPMVTNGVTRDVAVAAAAVASLDALTGGRAFVVLGRGNAGIRSAGLRPSTLAELAAYFTALGELLDEGKTTFRGRDVVLRWPYPLRRVRRYLVAEGPKMLALAGSLADGVYLNTGFEEEVLAESVARVRAGASGAGRDPDGLELWWESRCAVAPTRAAALAEVREALSSAGNHSLRGDYGAKRVPEALRAPLAEYHARYDFRSHGRRDDGTDARASNASLMEELGLTDFFLDRFGIVGTPGEVVERLRALEALGVGRVNLNAWSREGLCLLGEEVLPKLAR